MATENADGSWTSTDGSEYPDKAAAETADTIYAAYNDTSRTQDGYYDALGNQFATQEEAYASDKANNAAPGATLGGWFADRYMKSGSIDWTQAAKDFGSLAAAKWAYDVAKNPPKTGYQGGIPTLTAQRTQANPQDPNVRPGAGGHRYMTDTGYADPKDTAGLAALQANIAKQKTDIDTANSAFDVAQLERQRIANLPNAITPDQFYGRVAQTPMTDAQKVKVPGATIDTLPAGQFTPEAYKPTTVVGGNTGIPTTVTGNADSQWPTASVAAYIRDQHLTPAQQLQAAAAFKIPAWQMDAANALLKSKDLTSVDAQSMDYARKVMIDPRLEAQNNADEAKAGLGWAYQAQPNTYSAKDLGVTVTGAMLDPTSATYRPDLAQGARDIRSAMTAMSPADAAALYKSKQDAYGFTDADFNKYAPASVASQPNTQANTMQAARTAETSKAASPQELTGGPGWALNPAWTQRNSGAGVISTMDYVPKYIQTSQKDDFGNLINLNNGAANTGLDTTYGTTGLSDTKQQAAQTAAPTGIAAIQQNTSAPTYAATGGASAGAKNYSLADLQSAMRIEAGNGVTPEQMIKAASAGYGVNEADVRSVGQSLGFAGYAQGGLMGLAKGGMPNAPRYLQGNTDGMADKIPARIDGQQEAALAHGEFVVPADVVSHLGNGNSDAGADVLYKMMDKIRKARTGNKKQGKQIDPNKFTPGGLAYAAGGSVLHFAGTTGSAVPAGTVGVEENLSNWAGPYVTQMLGQGQALANAPYQAYQGPLTAGDSALQTQGYQNAAALQTPTSMGQAANTAGNVATNFNTLANAGYPTSQAVNQFTTPGAYQGAQNTSAMFGNDQAQAYMNPYLQQSLDPQLAEARRQSQISQQTNNAQATQAGAFGGARQGIMAAENQRNLGSNLANITGQGYNTAYNNAQQQFNADQARLQNAQAANEQSRQFGANYGMTGAQQSAQYGQAAQAQNEASNQFSANYGLQALQGQLSAAQAQGNLGATQNQAGLANLQAQLAAGSTQQATAQAGVAADQAAFNAERDNPYKMVQYQQSLLAGLPITAQQYNISTNPYIAAAATFGEATKVAG